MGESDFERLRQLLSELPAGSLASDVQPELVQRLADCWHMFSESGEEAMEAYKLERMEELEWHPPVLAFTIERHGGTALGSSRAELQDWFVDLDRRVAQCKVTGYRQLYPRAASVDVKSIAAELVGLILKGSKDERLQWSAGGGVRMLTGRIFPADSAPKQTVEGRRLRLFAAVQELMASRGWELRGSWYRRKE